MTRLFSMSIRVQVLLIVFIVALPAAGISIYSGINRRSEVLAEAYRDTQKLVDEIATHQQNLVSGAEQLMTALAQLPEVKHHDRAKVEPILRELTRLSPMYSDVSIADQNGTVWATATHLQPPHIADRRFFKNALASGRMSSGEYVVSRAISRPVFHFGYPLKDNDGDVTGVISIGFIVYQYRLLLERMQAPAGTNFVLCDHRGIILSDIHSDSFVGKEYPPETFRQMRGGAERGTFISKGFAGDRRIMAYRKVTLKGELTPYMYITAGVPVEVALKQANRMLLLNAALLVSFLIGAFFLAWLMGKRSIVDRVTLLEEASQRLATGNLEVRVSELVAGGELGRLGQTFDTMAQQLALREKALRESEKFLTTIIESEPECVKLLAADGSILMINRAGLDMIQVEAFDRVKGKSLYPFIDPEYLEAFQATVKDVFDGKHARLQFKLIGAEGRLLWLDTHAVPLRDDSGKIFSLLGITLDITERKRTEEEREQLLVQLEAILNSINEGVVVSDLEGNILTMNPSALALSEYESVEQVRQPFRQYLETFEISDLNGRPVPFEQWPLSRALHDERFVDYELRARRKDTGKSFSGSYSGTPVHNKAGEAILAVITVRDVTERKRMEAQVERLGADLAARAGELEEANRELEAFNYTVAHDLRKPLTVINGYCQVVLETCSDNLDEQCKAYLKEACEGTLHMSRLINALLNFSRMAHAEPKHERVDLCGICEKVASELKAAEPERKVTFHLPREAVVEADPDWLYIVLGNLFGNAWKYTSTREEAVIEFGATEIGGQLAYFVRDNGLGFDPAKADQLFAPFQRLESRKEIGGLGIGLATVDRIIKRHDGKVWAKGEPGKGATFFFTLGRSS